MIKEGAAFNEEKALSVEEDDESLMQSQMVRYARVIKKLRKQTLRITKVASTEDWVWQLGRAAGWLYGLTSDRLMHLAADGSVCDTVSLATELPSLSGACDMHMCRSGRWVVAATKSGLVLICLTGGKTRRIDIDAGTYLSVTYNDHWSFWAVKDEKQGELWTTAIGITDQNFEQLVKIKTNIKSGGKSVYCTQLQGSLFLCSSANNCVYKIDTSNGQTLAQYGQKGSQAAGQLDSPTTIYSDHISQSLLICDQNNHRLQMLKPNKNRWTVVRTQGQQLECPLAVNVDDRENLWVSSSELSLYKGNFTT